MVSRWRLFKQSLSGYVRTLRLFWLTGKGESLGVLLLTVAAGAVPVGTFYVTQHLVGAITAAIGRPAGLWSVLPWLFLLVSLRIFLTVADQLREPLRLSLRENLESWLFKTLAGRTQATPLDALQTAEFQNALTRAGDVSGGILEDTLWWIVVSAQRAFGAAGLCLVLFRYSPWLTVLPLLSGTLSWLRQRRFAADIWEHEVSRMHPRRERDALEGVLTDRVAAKEIRLYQAGDAWIERWQDLWLGLMRGREAIELRKFRTRLVLDVVRGAFYAACLFLLLQAIERGRFTIGAFVAAMGALVQLEGIWYELAEYNQTLGDRLRRLDKDLYSFLSRTPVGDIGAASSREEPAEPASRAAEDPWSSAPDCLRLEGISYTYPGKERPLFEDLNVEIKRGERVALVGLNGAGKTTLARLLLGLYRPQAGRLTLGSADFGGERIDRWRGRCSVVCQDFARYHLTAGENVGFGDLRRPDRIPAAAEAGDAAAVIHSLPNGFECMLGPTFGGQDLSGGQWQRLAIARGFMREEPWLIVLDEPSASLDPLAELNTFRRFIELTQGRTALLISHRLSSVRWCDRILVLDAGKVVEDGTHDALLRKGGLYTRLFEAQAQWYA